MGDYDSELVIGFLYLKYLENPCLKENIHQLIFGIYDARFALEEHELETEKKSSVCVLESKRTGLSCFSRACFKRIG